jgi:phenylacetate-coenzyme A ligase PaaK-like adenylate-forming protein
MPSRADELLKVKGMLINPEAVIDLLLANGQIDEFQIVIDREDKDDALSGDRFRLLVDTGPKTDLESLSESVRLAIGVRPEIEITPRAKIFDPEKSLKAKRLLDLRKSS